jgi:hypothetical protein
MELMKRRDVLAIPGMTEYRLDAARRTKILKPVKIPGWLREIYRRPDVERVFGVKVKE